MGDHVATSADQVQPTPAQVTAVPTVAVPTSTVLPTQTQFPMRTAIRTFVQVILPAAVTLGLLVPTIVDVFLQGTGQVLPPSVVGWLTAASAAVGVVAGALARVMAIPGVEAWVRKYLPWLAATN